MAKRKEQAERNARLKHRQQRHDSERSDHDPSTCSVCRAQALAEQAQPDQEIAALVRMQNACIAVSALLDEGVRDPTWHETQEFENAGLAYGRILRGKSS